MKKFLLSVLFVLIAGQATAWDVKDMNLTIDRTNFQVNAGCSGTLISPEGHILTANHCVENQYVTIEKEVIKEDGTVKKEKFKKLNDGAVTQYEFRGTESIRTVTYKVKLIAVDKDLDLALVQIKDTPPATVMTTIACKAPIRGEPVYIVGNPKGYLYASVVKGIVSSVQRDYDRLSFQNHSTADATKPLMQISGGVIGGNSGGAVYNESGELIGVPVLAFPEQETLGFAAPLDSVRSFLTANKLGQLFDHCGKADNAN